MCSCRCHCRPATVAVIAVSLWVFACLFLLSVWFMVVVLFRGCRPQGRVFE